MTTADGYFRTGDVAVLLPDGQVKIVDRMKDMVLVSGFNVYPNEVEEVLVSHPGVLEAAVIGIPDEHSGEAVAAYIVKKDPNVTATTSGPTPARTSRPTRSRGSIEFRESLPKTNVGKVLRRVLARRGPGPAQGLRRNETAPPGRAGPFVGLGRRGGRRDLAGAGFAREGTKAGAATVGSCRDGVRGAVRRRTSDARPRGSPRRDLRVTARRDTFRRIAENPVMWIKQRRGWEIPEVQATAEAVFVNRRALLAGCGAVAGGLALRGAPGARPARRSDLRPLSGETERGLHARPGDHAGEVLRRLQQLL